MARIDRDNIDQLTSKANELFEGVEIKEEDFQEQFDNHIVKEPELFSRKEDLLDVGSACSKYEPCPICYKCRVKASHIYIKCDECSIDLCIHKDEHINRFIIRDNFKQPIDKEVCDLLKDKEKELS